MQHLILEFVINRTNVEVFHIELLLWLPDNQPQRIADQTPLLLDFERLYVSSLDPHTYGQVLSKMLFADKILADTWCRTYDTYTATNTPIRVRVTYPIDSDELHGIHWELLQDPRSNGREFLTLDENLRFSRFFTSIPYTKRTLTHEFRALAVIANPDDLDQYHLPPLDVVREVAFIEQALEGIPVVSLGSAIGDQRVTFAALEHALRIDPAVLYLAAHSRRDENDTKLWLEGADGGSDLVSVDDMVQLLRGSNVRPYLVVLASCHSAGEDTGALLALGPQLVLAGIPAVLAMPGPISQQTLQHLLPEFFASLRRYGQIDLALAKARRLVRRFVSDWWKPILFLSLHTGQLWPEEYLRALDASRQGSDSRRSLIPREQPLFTLHRPIHIHHDIEVEQILPLIQQQGITIQTAWAREQMLDRYVLVTVMSEEASSTHPQTSLENIRSDICKREAAARYCSHLPRIYGMQMVEGKLWIMQEWIEGTSLRTLYPLSGALPSIGMLYDIVKIILAICPALVALHNKKVQHGNISPDHIIVQHSNADQIGRGVVLLNVAVDGTGHPMVAHVEPFQAPEQRRRWSHHISLHPPIDVYGLGATLYTLLTHNEPPRSLDHPLQPASTIHAGIPSVCDELFMRALAPHPRDRYQSIEEFASAIRTLLPAIEKHAHA